MKTFVFTCLFAVLLLPSCRNEPIRVGAPNQTASVTLTTLQVTADSLLAIRKQIDKGNLPQSIVPTYNNFSRAYTTAKDAFRAYNDALGTPLYSDKYLTSLKVALAALDSASLQFDKEVKGK